jgi:DNA-directed RNA polymerase III subunit RPC1
MCNYHVVFGWQGIKTVERVVIAQKKLDDAENDQGGPKYNMFVEG